MNLKEDKELARQGMKEETSEAGSVGGHSVLVRGTESACEGEPDKAGEARGSRVTQAVLRDETEPRECWEASA